MLKKLYIDNYRSFVNFELSPDRLSLLLGPNGTGKSSLFDVIQLLRDFISGTVSVQAFTASSLTRWQTVPVQTFSMGLTILGKIYTYDLVIEHDADRGLRRVASEQLLLEGKPLYLFKEGKAQLYRDDHSKGPLISFDWSRSGIGLLQADPANSHLRVFREYIFKITVISIDPRQIIISSERESTTIDRFGADFVSWYRSLALENPVAITGLMSDLKELMPGFSTLMLAESGDKRVLRLQFQPPSDQPEARYHDFSINELSDGQRSLLVLYALLRAFQDKQIILCLDEPDNFVALREIQPWLSALEDLCDPHIGTVQALIVSHNPEVLNSIGGSRAILFERLNGGPTRLKKFVPVDGLTASETIARGWE
jgi:ABC-type lipoprotein export system ATPase subunit